MTLTGGMAARSLIARSRTFVLLACSLAVPVQAHSQTVALRPRIGLALGGGAARGLAHIGVLQWLEEHRIPVDFVAGTSMGALVGGAYATGMSPAEMRTLMRTTDWDGLLRPDSPFADKTFHRKQDKRDFPSPIELGLRHGVTLPSGINPGQSVGLILDRLALAYYDVERFDELPTPFRCLALDLRTAQPVVLSEGSLARAMRATMAIPGVFTPVDLDNRLLVDGGAANNVPGDVVREMGADIVIAVDVSSGSQGLPPGGMDNADLLKVLGRTLDVMMAAGSRAGLAKADVVVVPDLGGLDGMAWRKSDALADYGYRAAEAQSGRLLAYALGEEEYAAHVAARAARRRSTLPVLRLVRVVGARPADEQAIVAALQENIGRPADPALIERGIRRVAGSDRYGSVDYRIASGPDGPGLLVTVHSKTYGPPFLALGLGVDNVDASHVSAYLAARMISYDTFGARSEIRNDVVIGTRMAYRGEVFKPVGRSPLFVAPRVSLTRDDRSWFSGDESQGESRVGRAGAGLDIGLFNTHSAELRAGFDAAYVRGRPLVGTPEVASFDGAEQFASLRAAVDGQNGAVVPSRGVYLNAQLRRFFATPRAYGQPAAAPPDRTAGTGVDGASLDSPSRFWQAEFRSSLFLPVLRADRIFFEVSGGTSFGERPLLNDFALGGPFRLGAFNPEQLRGPAYALGVAGYLKRVGRLLGGDVFGGGWFEAGSTFESVNHSNWEQVISAGLIVDSMIGPIFAGGSVAFDGHHRLYIAIGHLWR